MNSNMVSALLIFGSLVLVILCTDAADGGQFDQNCSSDSAIHIARAPSTSGFNFNSITGSLDLNDKSTLAISAKQMQGCSFPPLREEVLRVGVRVRSNIAGFSIGVFESAIRQLPYKFPPYELISFNGSSDELVKELVEKTFDVALGDIVITSRQHPHVEFSLPYLEPGFNPHVKFSLPYLEPGFMMVRANTNTNALNNFWWFLSPFTPVMWLMIITFTLYIRVLIWLIERQDENGPKFLEVLFFLHRPPFQNNAARILSILWVLVMLLLSLLYARMLTIMLVNSQEESFLSDFDSLKRTNAVIGCDEQSQAISYLIHVLRFRRRNVVIINDYAEALSSGNIDAAFLLAPYGKVFLAKHGADFTEIKPTYNYNLSGFGFVFPKDSPFASDISAAILELEERGELQLMEEEMLSFLLKND